MRHGLKLFDVEELPTHGGSLRIFARHAEDASRAVEPGVGSASCRGPGGPDAIGELRRLRGGSEQDQAGPVIVSDRGEKRRQNGRRLRGSGQGEHAAQLLRRPQRPAGLHGRSQPLQAGQVFTRHAHPDPSSRPHWPNAARLCADPPLEPERRDQRAAGFRPGMGAQFVVPIPQVQIES